MSKAALSVTTTSTNASAVQTETVRAAGLTGTAGLYIPGTADIDDRLFLYIRETANGATGLVWIKAGDMDASGQGDLSVTVGGSAALVVGPLEGARFRNAADSTSSGAVYVDSGITGVFTAISAKL